MTFYETVVLKNYKVYKKDEKKNVLQNALPFIDDFLLQTWHYETMITDNNHLNLLSVFSVSL